MGSFGKFGTRIAAGVAGVLLLLPAAGAGAATVTKESAPTVGTVTGQGPRDLTTVNMGDLPGVNCWYEVKYIDMDGQPGGDKFVHIEPLCPNSGPDPVKAEGFATVDMSELPTTDCWYEVKSIAMDDKPGGDRFTHAEMLCP